MQLHRLSTAKLTQRESLVGTLGHQVLNHQRCPTWRRSPPLTRQLTSHLNDHWSGFKGIYHHNWNHIFKTSADNNQVGFLTAKFPYPYECFWTCILRSRSVLEYVPAEYFRGESSLYGPPTMSVYCASRLVRWSDLDACFSVWLKINP